METHILSTWNAGEFPFNEAMTFRSWKQTYAAPTPDIIFSAFNEAMTFRSWKRNDHRRAARAGLAPSMRP